MNDERNADEIIQAQGAEKSLRWLANMFATEEVKDETDKISRCIQMYCTAGANCIAELEAQLAASQSRERAAVEDLKKHRKYKCDCCYYADKQGRYIPCRDCQSPISNYGDGWQWRGPQEAGKGDSNG